MASFNEYSIGKFASCLNRNKDLLTKLFQANEPVYYSQLIGDDANKNYDINELIDLHIVNILGKDMLSLTPEFHEMISKAFSVAYLVSDYDVMRYKEKLEVDIEDCNASIDYKHDIYLRRVKNDIGEIIMVMSSSVDELNVAVEREFKYTEDNELKKEHLIRFLNTDKKLRDLIGEVDTYLFGSTVKKLQQDSNDGELDSLIMECLAVFSRKGTDLLKLLTTINIYLNEINKKIEEIEKIHRIKALKNEGKLSSPEYSNLKEFLSTDSALWHESGSQHPFYIPLEEIRESPFIKDALLKAKIHHELEIFRNEPAGPVDSIYNQSSAVDKRKSNPQEIMNLFQPSGKNLYSFIEEFDFGQELTLNEKINYFVYFACVYHRQLIFTDDYIERDGKKILIVYPKK